MGKKYHEIYSSLLNLLEEKTIKPGEILPSEKDLMQTYNASRDTVRKALALLVENGYIQKNQGKGSVVIDHNRLQFPISGLTSFKELKPTMSDDVVTKVVCLEKLKADSSSQKKLQLSKDDEIWYIERVRIVDKEAIILDIDIVNAQIVPNLTKEILEDSLYEYIEEQLKLKVGFSSKEITVQEATFNDQNLLDMKHWTNIVSIKSYSYLENAQLFQYTESRHRPDKFRFVEFARRNKLF